MLSADVFVDDVSLQLESKLFWCQDLLEVAFVEPAVVLLHVPWPGQRDDLLDDLLLFILGFLSGLLRLHDGKETAISFGF